MPLSLTTYTYWSNSTIRNNIYYNVQLSRQSVAFCDSDYNLFYAAAAWPGNSITAWIPAQNKMGYFRTLADFQAVFPDQELNSVALDPLIPTDGYVPAAGSPVGNAGDPDLGTLFSLPSSFVDFDGVARPAGGAYDIGAHEIE